MDYTKAPQLLQRNNPLNLILYNKSASIRSNILDLNIKKPLIIAGNGPSLSKIDYARLPNDYDVFRCNQFYFETHYYLGDEIALAFFNPALFFNQFFTAQRLVENGDYKIKYIVSNHMRWFTEGNFFMDNDAFRAYYPNAILLHELIDRNRQIHGFLKYNDTYLSARPTSGALMALAGGILGYREIYLVGIDLYKNGDYAFPHDKENISHFVRSSNVKDDFHKDTIDIECFKRLQSELGCKVQSLSPHSPLEELFPFLDPIENKNFELKPKRENAILDIELAHEFNPQIPKRYVGNLLQMYEDIAQIKRDLHVLKNENLVIRLVKHFKMYFGELKERLKRYLIGGGGKTHRNKRSK